MTWLALLAIGVLLAACSPAAPPVATERPIEREAVRTTRAQRGELGGVLSLGGEIRPRGAQTLTSRVPGRLDRLHVDLGAAVQEGQPLAEVDPAGFALRAAQAEAALATAEARLAALRAGGPEGTAQAEAMLRGARARLEALEQAASGPNPEQLLAEVQAARERVAELEGAGARAAAEAEARAQETLKAARDRLEQLQRQPAARPSPSAEPSRMSETLAEARRALEQAEAAALTVRRPPASEELSKARRELAAAQDTLLLARAPVGEAELEAARAEVEAAEIAVRRAGEQPSEVALRSAEAEAQRAQVALEVARLEAREATVVAPFSGVVSEVFALQDNLVAPGTPLLTVVPPTFEVRVALPEAQLPQVAVGQPVRVAVDTYPDQEFTGAVRAIAPSVDPRTREVLIRVEVADPGFKLKSGMFAHLGVVSPVRQDVLFVPREAVVGQAGEQNVYVVTNGRARRQPVQVGASDGRHVEVLAGLNEGAEVVLSSAAQADGATIR